MVKGRNSSTLTIRLPDELLERLRERAERAGMSPNAYVKRCVEQQLRRR